MASASLPAVPVNSAGAVSLRDLAPQTLGGVHSIQTTIEQLKAIRTFVKQELVKDVDFGVIPGTGNKDVLLQPGAQKVAMFYNTYPEFDCQRVELGDGHLEVLVTTRLVSRNSREVVAMGMGSCTSMESKYRFRNAARKCPKCGADKIIKGKEEWGGGWICHKKQGGCGAKFRDGDASIEAQSVGRIENQEIHDQRNTILKMAMKRSMVSAAISLGCMSELFTQDLDDVYDLEAARAAEAPQQPSQPTAAQPGPAPRESEPVPSHAETWAKFAATSAKEHNDALEDLCELYGVPEHLRSEGKVNVHQLAQHIASLAVEAGAPAPKKRTQEWASTIATRLFAKKRNEVERAIEGYLGGKYEDVRAELEGGRGEESPQDQPEADADGEQDPEMWDQHRE